MGVCSWPQPAASTCDAGHRGPEKTGKKTGPEKKVCSWPQPRAATWDGHIENLQKKREDLSTAWFR